jgi:hypothetical protein
MTTLPGRPRTAVPVIDVQRRLGVLPEPTRPDSEPLVHKRYRDSFEGTELEDGNAHTTTTSAPGAPPPDQVIAHTNLYWQEQQAPGRAAAVTASAAVLFGG